MYKSLKTLVLNIARENDKLRVHAYEKISGEEESLKQYQEHRVSFNEIELLCKKNTDLLSKANRRGDITPELTNDLKKVGQSLYDELLTQQAKTLLRSTIAETLLLYIDDQLVHIPWELLFDGESFLCIRFGIGRIVSTRQSVAGIQKRVKDSLLNMLVIADPQNNLEAAYKEGVSIRDELSNLDDLINVDLVSSKVELRYIKENIRDFDIVHYAGHADYDLNEYSNSGWIVSDGKLSASDIMKMAGGAPMPFVIFSNACHSGRTGEWHVTEEYEREIYSLANAFLLSGVTHYVGTFWEVLDKPSYIFSVEFYKALSQRTSIGIALRQARRRLVELYGESTIIWASYMLYGDPDFMILDKKAPTKDETLQFVEASKESAMNNKDTVRSPGKQPELKSPKQTAKILFGILAIILLIALYWGINKLPKDSGSQLAESGKIGASPDVDLELSMNIIGQREESDGSISEVIIKEGSILHSYDNFQVHFRSNKDAYIYILIYDSTDEVHQLFPDPKISLSNNIKSGKDYSVPPSGSWFWLDDQIGIETIYIMASETPLNDINSLISEMNSATSKDKTILSSRIKNSIQSLERGVGGITEGKVKSFHLKNGKKIQSITEIIKGKASVVRAISFRHIEKMPYKDINLFKDDGKIANKKDIETNKLQTQAELAVTSSLAKTQQKVTSERTIRQKLHNVHRNLILEETRGIGGVKVYKNASPAVVLVATNESIGSGSVLDDKGHILTNWHVVNGYSEVAVIFKPKKGIKVTKENAYVAKVIKLDEIADLALLKLVSHPSILPTIKMGSIQDVDIGQEVHAIGHPNGEIWTYTQGIISQIRPEYAWTYDNIITHKSKVIQTQTPISPGNSGGPLLNDRAEIIGINSFVKKGSELNFAVSVDVIKEFIRSKESRIAQKHTIKDDQKDSTYYEYDSNEDGVIDALGIDTNENGTVETFMIDKNQDGEVDYIAIDTDENGKLDAAAYDTDKNSKYDTWAYDLDEDGKVEMYGFDDDEDGEIDRYSES